jgi:5'-nucleotidase
MSYSTEVDFSTAAHFAAFFGRLLLERSLPPGVNLIKVDIPANATPETPWDWTQLSRQRYYSPTKPKRSSWDVSEPVGYDIDMDYESEPETSDVYTLIRKRRVSVTPLTLDMTARVDEKTLKRFAG